MAEQMVEQKKAVVKSKVGRVVSNRMQKTVVVEVESAKRHPLYGRTMRERARFKAHDENEESRIGDWVRIEETRPISRDKRWRVVEITRRAEQL